MWTTHPEAWNTTIQSGSHAFRFKQRLALVRDTFKAWNKTSFGRVEKEIEDHKERLKRIQEQIYMVDDVKMERKVREHLEELLYREEILWTQKAKTNWDTNGDRNTKYFQAVVKNRRRRNRITQIMNDNDHWVTEPRDIEYCFHNHFHNFFAQPQNEVQDMMAQLTTLPLPTLTDYQSAQLDMPITDEEIISAVNQLGPLKTPGPDGIPAAFYKKFWSTVRTDILHMVKAFFHSGTIRSLIKSMLQQEIIQEEPGSTIGSPRIVNFSFSQQ